MAYINGNSVLFSPSVNISDNAEELAEIKEAIEYCDIEIPDGTPASDYDDILRQGYDKQAAQAEERAAQAWEEGTKAGQQSEYDRFWNDFQQNGNRTNYVSE